MGREISSTGFMDFGHFKVQTNEKEIFDALNKSSLLTAKGLLDEVVNRKS